MNAIRTAGRQVFSLDFDDTFTADPELWTHFINKAQVLGHSVYIVTARDNSESNLREIKNAVGSGVPVIMTGNQQKRSHCIENDIEIDIWIDDYPEAIVGDREALELSAAYDEVERLRLLVEESRFQRDNARSLAMESLNKEMAELRSEITRLKGECRNERSL